MSRFRLHFIGLTTIASEFPHAKQDQPLEPLADNIRSAPAGPPAWPTWWSRSGRLFASVLLAASATLGLASVPRSEVFPIESLAPELRQEAEKLLLLAMDREALYTVIGGIKPMSSGFFNARIDIVNPDTTDLERVRRILSAFRVGDSVTTSLQPFARSVDGKRHLEAVIFHRASVREAISLNPDAFGPLGITASSEPIEAVLAADADQSALRNRAFGVLFGYPKHAVDFFVKASESQRRDGRFVERDFLHIPVFERPENRFVYAVPKGHQVREEDERLRLAAKPILAMYRSLREKYIGEGKPGAAALLRDWMDDGTGNCSSETARRKAERFLASGTAPAPLPSITSSSGSALLKKSQKAPSARLASGIAAQSPRTNPFWGPLLTNACRRQAQGTHWHILAP